MGRIGKWALAIGFCTVSFALAVRAASDVAATLLRLSHGDLQIVNAVCWVIAIFCLAFASVAKVRSDAREPEDGRSQLSLRGDAHAPNEAEGCRRV